MSPTVAGWCVRPIDAIVRQGRLIVRQSHSIMVVSHRNKPKGGSPVKKLILAGALLLAAPGAQAQGTSSNPTNRPVQAPSVTGGTADQHQQFNPTNTQPTSTNTSGNTGAANTRNVRH